MKELAVDLWTEPADARCITTNGFVKKDMTAVMGRGVAKQATVRYPGIAQVLGYWVREHGNNVHVLMREDKEDQDLRETKYDDTFWYLVSFPVKHNWYEAADLSLIVESAKQLVELTDEKGWKKVLLPRPGCGNGKRDWESEVKPLLELLLDDRFVAIDRP